MEKIYQVDPDYKNLSWALDRERLDRKKTPENKALEYFFEYKNPIIAVNKEIDRVKESMKFSDSISKKYLLKKYGVDIDDNKRKEISFLKKVKECLKPIISKPGCY